MVDELLSECCFVTSYNNFISDHKSITARIGHEKNVFSKEFKAKLTFDRESHLKSKKISNDEEFDDTTEHDEETESSGSDSTTQDQSFDIEDNHYLNVLFVTWH